MKRVLSTLMVFALLALTSALVSCSLCPHMYGEWEISTEATCAADGEKVRECQICKNTEKQAYKDENAHAFGEWQTADEATCKKHGTEERVCTLCGGTEERETTVNKSAHTFGEWETADAATCQAGGSEERVCTSCGFKEKRETAINEDAHVFGEWAVVREATCSRQGEKSRSCTLCDYDEAVIIPRLTEGGHTYGDWQISIEPTCSKEGQRVRICQDCKAPEYEKLSPLDEGGHSYGEWYTVTDPTCSDEGEKKRDCVYCDEKQSEAIPVLEDGGHKFGEWIVSIEPTCSTEGEQKRQCSLCEKFDVVTLSPLDEGGHAFGEWYQTVKPTCDEFGEEKRECGLCDEFETKVVDKLPIVYTITVNCDGATTTVNLPADGIYSLSEPTKLGYTFIGYKDGESNFPLNGVVTESKSVTAAFEVTPTLTFAELKARIEGGVDKVLIGNDIVLTETIYVTDACEIYTDGSYTLTRSPEFLGDLFVMGETASGENVILNGTKANLTFKPAENASITIDGNKANITGTVSGTVFFMLNGSVLNIHDGVIIKNNLKLGNEKIFNEKYALRENALIGGSVAIIDDGTFNMYGGEISNNAVNLKYCSATPEEERVEGYTDSSYGGAIYSIGAVNIYSGLIDSNEASYAGAIFSSRTLNIEGGIISNNYASSYGGALFGSNNGSGINYIGSPEGDKKEINVIFRGNSAKGGGAIYQQYNNAMVIYGNTLFEENQALGKMGGAIFTGGELIVYYAEFKNNIAADRGGALYGTYSEADKAVRVVDIKEAIFDGNSAARGGAIAASATTEATGSGVIFELGNVTFRNNAAFKTESSNPSFIDNVDREGVSRNYNGNGAVAHFTAKCEIHFYGKVDLELNAAESKGGALYLTNQAKLKTLDGAEVSFNENTSAGYGGAIYLTNGSSAELNGVKFTANRGNRGGAIALISSGDVKLNGVIADGNKSSSSGGFAYVELSSLEINSTVGECKIINSESIGSSAGAFYLEGSTLNLIGTESSAIIISGNISDAQGGAICSYVGSVTTEVTDETTGEVTTTTETVRSEIIAKYVTFENNKSNAQSQYGGGAIYASNTDVDIQNSVFNNNEAIYGGAISLYSGSVLTAVNTSFTNNTAKVNGGVMYTSKSTASFENVIVNGNKATGYDTTSTEVDETTGEETTVDVHVDGVGGAFFFNSTSTASFSGISASGNSADIGGFMNVSYSTVTVSEGVNEFTGNIANINGGAFYVNNDSSLTLSKITATKNEAENGGFIYVDEATSLTINGEGNVISENVGKSVTDQYGAGAIYVYKTATSISNATFNKNTGNCGGAVGIKGCKGAASVEFNNCTFTYNSGTGTGGTFYFNTSEVTINNSTVSGSESGKNGGAIYSTTCTVNTNNSIFKANSAVGNHGGVIYITKTTFNSNGDTFETNTAKNGGALAINSSSTAIVNESEFKSNTAAGNGGAIWLSGKSSLEMTSGTVTENKANLGGGIYITVESTTFVGNDITVSDNEATEDSADGYGGGIHIAAGATATITDLTLKNNKAAYGGGIAILGGSSFTVNGITASGNKALGYTNEGVLSSGNGGAINAGAGTLILGKGEKITSNTFTGNRANSGGGAIYIFDTETSFTANEIVANNNEAATNYGGALYIRGAAITVNIGVITANSNKAGGNGGAIYLYAFKAGKIGTIVANNNSTSTAGGALYIAGKAEVDITSLSGEGNTASTNGGFAYIGTSTVKIHSGEIGDNNDVNGYSMYLGDEVSINTSKFIYQDGELYEKETGNLVVITD